MKDVLATATAMILGAGVIVVTDTIWLGSLVAVSALTLYWFIRQWRVRDRESIADSKRPDVRGE